MAKKKMVNNTMGYYGFQALAEIIYVLKAYILSPNEGGISKSATFYLLTADGLRFQKRDFFVKFIILRS